MVLRKRHKLMAKLVCQRNILSILRHQYTNNECLPRNFCTVDIQILVTYIYFYDFYNVNPKHNYQNKLTAYRHIERDRLRYVNLDFRSMDKNAII